MNIKQIGILIVLSLVVCLAIYLIAGPGIVLLIVGVYIIANFLPFKKLWSVLKKGIGWLDDLLTPDEKPAETQTTEPAEQIVGPEVEP